MKIDLNKTLSIKRRNGLYRCRQDGTIYARRIGKTALLGEYQQERIDGPEKHRRFKLWSKLKAGGVQEISIEEAALFKSLIGMGWGPLWLAKPGIYWKADRGSTTIVQRPVRPRWRPGGWWMKAMWGGNHRPQECGH